MGETALQKLNWPDPGLSRNTRCRCYRCSVPGLAGFTKLALCGARDLIKGFCTLALCLKVLLLRFLCAPLCSLWCVFARNSSTTETQRTQRLHRASFGLLGLWSWFFVKTKNQVPSTKNQSTKNQVQRTKLSNLRLTMRKHPQKSIDEQMQYHIRDYRHYDGQ